MSPSQGKGVEGNRIKAKYIGDLGRPGSAPARRHAELKANSFSGLC